MTPGGSDRVLGIICNKGFGGTNDGAAVALGLVSGAWAGGGLSGWTAGRRVSGALVSQPLIVDPVFEDGDREIPGVCLGVSGWVETGCCGGCAAALCCALPAVLASGGSCDIGGLAFASTGGCCAGGGLAAAFCLAGLGLVEVCPVLAELVRAETGVARVLSGCR
jgi:hypothetical protein